MEEDKKLIGEAPQEGAPEIDPLKDHQVDPELEKQVKEGEDQQNTNSEGTQS